MLFRISEFRCTRSKRDSPFICLAPAANMITFELLVIQKSEITFSNISLSSVIIYSICLYIYIYLYVTCIEIYTRAFYKRQPVTIIHPFSLQFLRERIHHSDMRGYFLRNENYNRRQIFLKDTDFRYRFSYALRVLTFTRVRIINRAPVSQRTRLLDESKVREMEEKKPIYLEDKRVHDGHANHTGSYHGHFVTTILHRFRKLAKQLFLQTWLSEIRNFR